jgi:hypothetical protein
MMSNMCGIRIISSFQGVKYFLLMSVGTVSRPQRHDPFRVKPFCIVS